MQTFKQISVEQAHDILDEGHVCLIDMRHPEKYQLEHVANAINIPEATIDEFIPQADQSQTTLIYCNHGNGSKRFSQYLCEQGFTSVYSIDGGFAAWKQQYLSQD